MGDTCGCIVNEHHDRLQNGDGHEKEGNITCPPSLPPTIGCVRVPMGDQHKQPGSAAPWVARRQAYWVNLFLDYRGRRMVEWIYPGKMIWTVKFLFRSNLFHTTTVGHLFFEYLWYISQVWWYHWGASCGALKHCWDPSNDGRVMCKNVTTC